MKFNTLIKNIENTHSAFFKQTANAVNINLSLRNWFIGFYIIEFEQNGKDRAEYGKQLLQTIAEKLKKRGFSYRNLNLFRKFYLTYPKIMQSLTAQSDLVQFPILQLVTAELEKKLQLDKNQLNTISQLPTDQLNSNNKSHLISLLKKTSFTHFVELIAIDDPAKRKFFELLIIQTTPSVKELKRQINTLAYERVGLSKNTEGAMKKLQSKIIPTTPNDIVKSHYFLEFLEFNSPELVEESELEQALIKHLQNFILELGNGFCFETRQKRILIGEKYYFIDLVFYHRILKCHILIELKVNDFEHANASQLNTYINYFKKEIMLKTDNPPIGILLVTDKDKALVEYATAGMDENLFVSKYMLQLPNKKQLENFINNELKKM
jgi:predicted nuclease of restriction endonuclease-like (RecB) superfamily